MSNGLLLSDGQKVNNELENLDDYNYAGGCYLKYPFDKAKRDECEANSPKNLSAQSDLLLAKATLDKVNKPQQQGMTPLQIVGVVAGSLMAITVMVVVIKRVKARKG